MSAPKKKVDPSSVSVHAIASRVAAFLVPLDEIRDVSPEIKLDPSDHPSGLVIGLDVHGQTADGERQFGIVLGPFVDPCELAGDLEGLASVIVTRAAVDLGLDRIEAGKQARKITREARIAARRQTTEQAPQSVTCDFCKRSVAVIVGTSRYCSRHAEEYGVRPHGKIGEGP